MRRFLPILCSLAISSCATVPSADPGPIAAISAQHLSDDVKMLASGKFGGRALGGPGESRTIEWLVQQLKASGLEPGGAGGSWTQTVPMVHTRLRPGTMSIAEGGNGMELIQGKDVYVSTVQPAQKIAIANAPMVFVGYGVSAPERQWDDFKGTDLKGKVAVFLVNDPDFEAQAE